MNAPVLDMLPGLRAAIVGNSAIAALLATYHGSRSVHTRRPVPADAGYPMVVIAPVTRVDNDGINYFAPQAVFDVITYGEAVQHYRQVEEIAERIYGLFHRQRNVTVTGYSVTDIRCIGPYPAPVDDDKRIGRRVTLTARLFA